MQLCVWSLKYLYGGFCLARHIRTPCMSAAAAAAVVLPQVSLQGHERAVSCLDIEHSGNRLVSGSLDYTLRIFDFNGMKADLRSFRWGCYIT
jgi:WD40 repeat protein